MLNGFVLDIHNENGFECEIPLFRDCKLMDGLSIKSCIGSYSYNFLVLMAKSKKFIGSGFQSNIVQKALFMTPKGAKPLNLTAFSIDQEIIIDGYEHYLSIIIPPNSFGVFQLFPHLEG